MQHLAALVRSTQCDASYVDLVACDAFLRHVEGLAKSHANMLMEVLCNDAADRLLRRGLRHTDPHVASTARRIIVVILNASPSAGVHLLRAPKMLVGGKRPRDELAPVSSPLLHEALAAPTTASSAQACVRQAALQVARTALQVAQTPAVDAAVAVAVPIASLLTSLEDSSAGVAIAARELLCTMLACGHRRSELVPTLHEWWASSLPRIACVADPMNQPVPHFLLDRQCLEGSPCPPHALCGDALGADGAAGAECDPEPAIALAAALLEDALATGQSPASDLSETVLRDGDVLARCAALLPAALRPQGRFSAVVGHRVLALVTRLCETAQDNQSGRLCLLLPRASQGRMEDGEGVGRALSWLASEAQALRDGGAPIGAMRLAGACRPALSMTASAAAEPPPPVLVVVRAVRDCLDAEVGAPSSRALDERVESTRLTLLHGMRAAAGWSGTAWAPALISAGWPTLLTRLVDGLASGGMVRLGDVQRTHAADDTRLLRTAARSLAAVLAAGAPEQAGSMPEAVKALRSLAAAVAYAVGTAQMPLDGSGVRSLDSGAPRALLEAMTDVIRAHPLLLEGKAGGEAEGKAEGEAEGKAEGGSCAACLARSLRTAADSREAEVRRATSGAIEALLDVDGGLDFVTRHDLAPIIASLLDASQCDEAARAAAHMATFRLAASPVGWTQLRVHRPEWFVELWRELRVDALSDELSLCVLHVLRDAVDSRHLHRAATGALGAVLEEEEEEEEEAADEEQGGAAVMGMWTLAGSSPTRLLTLRDGLEAACGAGTSAVAVAAVHLLAAVLSVDEAEKATMGASQVLDVHPLRLCIEVASQHCDSRVRQLAARVLSRDAVEEDSDEFSDVDESTPACFFGACARSHECE